MEIKFPLKKKKKIIIGVCTITAKFCKLSVLCSKFIESPLYCEICNWVLSYFILRRLHKKYSHAHDVEWQRFCSSRPHFDLVCGGGGGGV